MIISYIMSNFSYCPFVCMLDNIQTTSRFEIFFNNYNLSYESLLEKAFNRLTDEYFTKKRYHKYLIGS